ncbi:MAG: phosphoribosylamine--glycine ligase [Patescibacteria group bacterium]|nr:phosphoribosylamine--glycine ligase [Patescibacteria group bacterium]MDD5715901.1 phosphoribosylamine--glycine ligase [Patescibacteria group bacterium]
MSAHESTVDILIIGGGGRELTIAWKLRQSRRAGRIFIAPGNAMVARLKDVEVAMLNGAPIKANDIEGLKQFALSHSIGLTVVGPEGPLCAGIVDGFEKAGLTIFGPNKIASCLEGSKAVAKELMKECGIPTAAFEIFTDFDKACASVRKHFAASDAPIVIKADGLCGGKGVRVCQSLAEAEEFLTMLMKTKVFGKAGTMVVIEDFLRGQEVSVMGLWDGKTLRMLLPSQDHKRVGDGDTGPNTGGMGAYAPVPWVTDAMLESIGETIFLPMLQGLQKKAHVEYRGVLYAGLICVDGMFCVLEYNVRFGDPETQAVLPLLKTDLLELMLACVNGTLDSIDLEWEPGYAVCVVTVAKPYPDKPKTGFPISGIADAETTEGVIVIDAGTQLDESGQVITASGRVLGVIGLDDTLQNAINRAYRGVGRIGYDHMGYRHDIGRKGLIKQ